MGIEHAREIEKGLAKVEKKAARTIKAADKRRAVSRAVEECWRCGSHDCEGRALVIIECRDGTYSGVFQVQLCWTCTTHPHGELPVKARIL